MRILPLCAALVIALPMQSLASCYVIGDFKGVSAMKIDEFEIDTDGMTGQKFILELDAGTSSAKVTPSDLACGAMSESMVICTGRNTVEIYAIDAASNNVTWTQSRSGVASPFEGMNGAKLMVGNILGTCDQ